MRAVSLHRDVIVVTSALLQVNCVIVRGGGGASEGQAAGAPRTRPGESVRDRLAGAARTSSTRCRRCSSRRGFPPPSGLLATHGDWDHLLGARSPFPGVALGCAESTAERLQGSPGEAQRELRSFDEELC